MTDREYQSRKSWEAQSDGAVERGCCPGQEGPPSVCPVAGGEAERQRGGEGDPEWKAVCLASSSPPPLPWFEANHGASLPDQFVQPVGVFCLPSRPKLGLQVWTRQVSMK